MAPPTIVYTDGACSGNPGPGGWAWAVPGGAWARGHDPDTTNQRMELRAVLEATRTLEGELDVVTDSTYVANCFRDGWWKGWERRGWRNSQKQPVANRDLWEPLIEAHKAGRFGVPRWVKGHSGDVMNDLVDRLAVASATRGDDGAGSTPPEDHELGPADAPGAGSGRAGLTAAAARLADMEPAERRAERRRRDGRIPAGTLCVTGGQRSVPEDPGEAGDLRRRLAEMMAGLAQIHDDLVVLTGLRPGAEALAGRAALDAGVDWVAVLPWPDPQDHMRFADRDEFLALRGQAPAELVLERKVPATRADRAKALTRRDAWLAAAADLALVAWDGDDADGGAFARRLEKAVGDDLVVLW
ncbi:ribonuclease HI [Iamia majanohamensis]|uniref:ribonuclease H n=1 Tax=Iamia majanohamensis TaxID=467976 RepID=A0AAE9YCI2_9ACTN|nr:ribonuclease H [Iamia majanohamensis]WCO68534.1 ribonuclease HI [Iamia majanohamensis]